MPGNVDLLLFVVGFIVGGGCVAAIGHEMRHEYDQRRVILITGGCALLAGLLAGWALDYFYHFAQVTS
jgi:hypothetical protein